MSYFLLKKNLPEKRKKPENTILKNDFRGGRTITNKLVYLLKLLVKENALKINLSTMFSKAIIHEFYKDIIRGLIASSPSVLAPLESARTTLG